LFPCTLRWCVQVMPLAHWVPASVREECSIHPTRSSFLCHKKIILCRIQLCSETSVVQTLSLDLATRLWNVQECCVDAFGAVCDPQLINGNTASYWNC
jgi:hypothetical protein